MTTHDHDNLPPQLDDLARHVTPGPSLVPPIMARVAQTQFQSSRPQLRRWIMRTSIGLAACIAIAFTLTLLLSPSHPAFADVLAKTEQTRTVTFDITFPHPHPAAADVIHVLIKGDRYRTEIPDVPEVAIGSFSTKTLLILNPTSKTATVASLGQDNPDFYAWIKSLKGSADPHPETREIAGRKLLGFHATRSVFGYSPRDLANITLWVDPKTTLPVRIDINPNTSRATTWINLRFDAMLDDSLFEMTIPNGYTLLARGDKDQNNRAPAKGTTRASKRSPAR